MVKNKEQYREGPKSLLSHNGVNYYVDKILEVAEKVNPKRMPVRLFAWVAKDIEKNKSKSFLLRVRKADLSFPIIVIKENNLWIPLDGYHRVCKSVLEKRSLILVKEITAKQLESCKVENKGK